MFNTVNIHSTLKAENGSIVTRIWLHVNVEVHVIAWGFVQRIKLVTKYNTPAYKKMNFH